MRAHRHNITLQSSWNPPIKDWKVSHAFLFHIWSVRVWSSEFNQATIIVSAVKRNGVVKYIRNEKEWVFWLAHACMSSGGGWPCGMFCSLFFILFDLMIYAPTYLCIPAYTSTLTHLLAHTWTHITKLSKKRFGLIRPDHVHHGHNPQSCSPYLWDQIWAGNPRID